MVGVLLETSIGQLSNDLYSSINWSRVGLKSFKEFRNSIFQEFEERELRFNIQYEKVTPFANQKIEMEYINEVQFVGKEEEFNLESFDIFEKDQIEEVKQDDLSLDDLVIEEELVSETSYVEPVGGTLEEDESPLWVEVGQEVEVPKEEVSNPYDDLVNPFEEVADGNYDELVNPFEEEVKTQETGVVTPPKVVERPQPRKREIKYHDGMSLRQFLRENPRSTMEVAEKYFTRRDIMKEIQLGRVIKRGQKLFI